MAETDDLTLMKDLQSRQAEMHLSDEELKPYFSLERMLNALFFTAGKLFGIEAELDDTVPQTPKKMKGFSSSWRGR